MAIFASIRACLLVGFIVAWQTASGQVKDVCGANIVVTGYWPPTNEMLRHFSTDPRQNPAGWQGGNWRSSGYNVYAFFPEFPPDGDPTNDAIGDLGSVGAHDADLRVDYQDTSTDFWRIVDQYEPRILVTTSRGGDISWELEAVEGGHGAAADWKSDEWGKVTHPLPGSVDPRSSDFVERYATRRVSSALPLQAIARATRQLNLMDVGIDGETSGSYLSGFMGLHGIAYHLTHKHNVAAGHIHVGRHVEPAPARLMLEETLATVIAHHPLTCDGQGEFRANKVSK